MKKKEMFLHMLREGQITPKRVFNFLKNYVYLLTKNPKPNTYPSVLMVEPSALCNLKCPLCPLGAGIMTRPQGNMHLDKLTNFIDEVGDYVMALTLYNFGEPFINKDMYSMIEYCKKKNIFVRVSSNGHFFKKEEDRVRLVKSKLDQLVIALDGASQETFSQYRKQGDFDEVVESLKRIAEIKKELNSKFPYIEIQFIIMGHNEHEVEKMKLLAKEMQVNKLTMKSVLLDEVEHLSDEEKQQFLPKNPKYSRYSGNLQKKQEVNSKYCSRAWLSSVVNWDGSVAPCCYDFDCKLDFGNAFETSFKKVWTGQKYVEFRSQILKDKGVYKICKTCPGTLFNFTLN